MIVLGYKAVSVYSVLSTGIGTFQIQVIFFVYFREQFKKRFLL